MWQRIIGMALALSGLTTGAGEPGVGLTGDLHQRRAREVMEHLQKHFWNRRSDLYSGKADGHEPDTVWGCGVMFSALVGGARHDERYGRLTRRYFRALDAYWDTAAEIPGYEPAPTQGGHDKYYDDNAWMVLTFAEAFEVTGDRRFLKRADETLKFVLSGWDDEAGGGIWWHEGHKDGSKNTCVNAPAALGCYRLARHLDGERRDELNAWGDRIVKWTVGTLRDADDLYSDRLEVASGRVVRGKLTYNTALMIRNFIALHGRTGKGFYLSEALRSARAAERLLGRSGGYRDAWKWSHLQVEADIETFRVTGERRYLDRALRTADIHYEAWKKHPPEELIEVASLARELWLLADLETTEGRAFWKKHDAW